MKYEYMHPRDEIALTLERIYNYKMTTTSGGNLSIKDDNGDIWITPARVDKGELSPKDIVCMRADGTVDGLHPPSSEFPFHKAVYDIRPDILSAFDKLEVLECSAEAIIDSQPIGGHVPMSQEIIDELCEAFNL